MKITGGIKKLLRKTIIGDFVTLWTAPIDGPSIKSIKEEAFKIGPEKHFEEFIFGNMIAGRKSN